MSKFLIIQDSLKSLILLIVMHSRLNFPYIIRKAGMYSSSFSFLLFFLIAHWYVDDDDDDRWIVVYAVSIFCLSVIRSMQFDFPRA